jgi:L-fucose isomerase-like protein
MLGVNLHNAQWELYRSVKNLRVDQSEGNPNCHAVEENISIAVQVN